MDCGRRRWCCRTPAERYLAYLGALERSPNTVRAYAENLIVLETGTGRRSPATVNRHLAGVFGFYDHHARSGVGVAGELVAWRRVSRGSYKPFLHHVTKGQPIPTRPVKLIVTRRAPRTLDAGQVAAIPGRPLEWVG